MKSASGKKLKVGATKESRQTKTRRRSSKESTLRVVTSASRRTRTKPPITLLTDFGTADYFVAAMKGVILSHNPSARIVDITHDIPAQDIEAAAFTLFAARSSFPAGTIHVAVVDPGVGSSRRAILVEASNQYFVGPDNGIFSYVSDRMQPRVFHLNNPKYFRHPVSDTFNGRDLFAPVAAALSSGVAPKKLGVEIDDYVRLSSLEPEISHDGAISGRVIHIDHFGNCVANITANELTNEMIDAGFRLTLREHQVETFHRFFAAETNVNKVFCVWGSAGFLEIAAKNQSAGKLLNVKRGDSVVVTIT
ncbi:MAG TPA: SAM-dependent chlorinase/fluorinase [Pyrinomonadaceae bacterium]|nr:SAM-dependent chlorinase/fluorinase [Pyrinomonadaceae bacterium]